MGQLILVFGGARSGKSAYAEKLAFKLGGKEVVYIATAAALDSEMEKRIDVHKKSRPQEWKTVEETMDVAKVICKEAGSETVLLLDCLTLLISNLLLDEEFAVGEDKEKAILARIEEVAKVAKEGNSTVIIVSNEVGLGLVPTYQLGREYRDITGRANQLVANYADKVFFTLAGLPIELKELSKKLEEGNYEC